MFVWSVVRPFDYIVWLLEASAVIAAAAILIFTYNKFRLTNLSYVLIWIHAVILLTGAHYTYARMPLFDWLKEAMDLGRNHYDRLGHIAQGFVPAIIAREILIRKSIVKKGGWQVFIVLCICLAISAFYELLEWGTAELAAYTGFLQESAVSFLATQGDVWDTQKDMALALTGAAAAIAVLSGIHNRMIEKLN